MAKSIAEAGFTFWNRLFPAPKPKVVRETLLHSDYEICATKQSLIDPHKEISVTVGLGCPKCRIVIRPDIEHAQAIVHECGLKMTRYGNALECELTVHR